ncbi:MAG: SAM-dependent methyltransferase [Burkholderiaceae bacterium]
MSPDSLSASPSASSLTDSSPLNAGTAALADLAQRERFFEALAQAIADGSATRVLLSKPTVKDDDLERVTARTLVLRGERCLSFVFKHRTKDITKNEPVASALETIAHLVGTRFAHEHLFTHESELQLMMSRKGRYTMHRAKLNVGDATRAAVVAASSQDDGDGAQHDRQKHRFLSLDAPFLTELGVTTARHELVPAMARKWKQINKFVEVMSHALESAGVGATAALNIVDFGAGKGYLTFALHDVLRRQAGGAARALDIVGVELRPDLVTLCNDAIAKCKLQGLRFEAGDVSSFVPERLDVMIALHACDTATDHALHTGIRAGASIIMCSPCCHKQIRPQMQMPALLKPMLQHGIHLGQQAEMVTDGLRALLLEAHGYDAQVFEFVALEHTSKNKMILAVRRTGPQDTPQAQRRRADVLAQIAELKQFYGIREHCLETLLAAAAPA